MRSAGGTKSGVPSFVTFATNARIAFFDAPSFQLGSGSAEAGAVVGADAAAGAGRGEPPACASAIPSARRNVMVTPPVRRATVRVSEPRPRARGDAARVHAARRRRLAPRSKRSRAARL